MSGDGIQHNLDVAGDQPDAFYGFKCFTRFCGGKGFNLRSADSTWILCVSSNNGDTGTDWLINTTSNSKYIGCRSEHAAGLGFGYVCTNSGNSSGGVLFQGCSTDQSNLYGFQAGGTISSVASNVHATSILLDGCIFRRDGANGGSGSSIYSGLYVNGYGGQVTVSGLNIWPGVADNGSGVNSPQYGMSVVSGSRVNLTGAYIQGAGTAIFDDGTNTINYDNSVVTAVGSTSSPTITASPDIVNYQGRTLSLVPGSAPSTDPLFINSNGSGNRAFGVRVVGQNNDTFKLTSDGKVALGPGSTTQDVALNRPSAGIVAVTDSGIGGSAMMRVSASGSQSSTTELFSAVCNASADVGYIAKVSGDTFNRYVVDSNGKQSWGPGTGTQDTDLYRSTAGNLKTDDSLEVGTNLLVDGTATVDGSLTVAGNALCNAQPADLALLGWSWDPASNAGTGVQLGQTGTAGAGVLNLIKIPLYGQSVSTTGVRLDLTTTGSSLTSTENYVFLFNSGGTFVAATADQTTAWNTGASTGAVNANWASGPYTISGAFCWAAVLYNGGTAPSFLRGSNLTAGMANGKLTAADSRYGSILSGITTNTPGNFTPSSITQRAATVWGAIF